MFNNDCDAVSKLCTIKRNKLASLFRVTFRQLPMIVQEKTMATVGYMKRLKKKEFCWIMKIIQKVMNKMDKTKNHFFALNSEAISSFYS